MNYRYNGIGNNDAQYGTNENDSIGKYILAFHYHKLYKCCLCLYAIIIYYFLCLQNSKKSFRSTNVSFMTQNCK